MLFTMISSRTVLLLQQITWHLTQQVTWPMTRHMTQYVRQHVTRLQRVAQRLTRRRGGFAPMGLLSLMLLGAGVGAGAGIAHAQGDESLIRFEADRISARETDGSLSLTVLPNMPLSAPLTFGIEIIPQGQATRGQIAPLENQIRLLPNQRSSTLNFILRDDADLTGDQIFEVRLYPIATEINSGILTSGSALVRLIDDETFAPARLVDLVVSEGDPQAEIKLTLDRPAEVPASATIDLFPDTAMADQDFVLTSGAVSISPGDREVRFPITILNDDLFEAEERFFARIIANDALEIEDYEAEITILDEDPAPILTFGRVQTNEGIAQGSLPVSLNTPAGVKTSATYGFVSGSAEAGSDFAATSGTVIFPAGVTQQLIPYELVDDARDEDEEFFTLAFDNPIGLKIEEPNLPITLIDNDTIPTLIVSEVSLKEGEDEAVVFRLNAASDRPISFGVRALSGTALIPDDIEPIERRFTIAPGQISAAPLILNPKVDEVYEQNEALSLEFFDAENVALPSNPITIAIVDEKLLPTLRLSDIIAVEGRRSNALTFEMTHPSSTISTFTLRTQSAKAKAGEDFVHISDVFSFPAGTTTLTIPLAIIDNGLNEGVEEFQVLISNTDGLVAEQTAISIPIEDDDPLPELRIAGLDQVRENSFRGLVLDLSLSEASGQPISFEAVLESDIGNVRRDFIPFDGQIRIPPGERQAQLVLKPRNDNLFEENETFSVKLKNAKEVSLPTQPFDFQIIDDDRPPVAELVVPLFDEGASAPASVHLSKPAGKDTFIKIGVFEGTARQGLDYTVGELDLLIPAGRSRVTLPIMPQDDGVYELEENFEIAILEIEGARVEQNVVQARIQDNDPAPTLSLSSVRTGEDSEKRGLMTFVLSTPTDQPVILDLEINDGTALTGADFLTSGGRVEFSPGQTEQTFNLQIVDDRSFEGPQTLSLSLITLRGAGLDDFRAIIEEDSPPYWVITIEDNDPIPRLSVREAQVQESTADGASQLVFALDQRAELPASFAYTLADAEAAAPDLILAPGTLTFQPGQTEVALPLTPLQDELDEDLEYFHLLLTDAQNLRLPDTAARILILDDDPAPILNLSDARASEAPASAADAMIFDVSLSAPSGRPITAQIRTAPDTTSLSPAEFGADMVPFAQSITFEPGETLKQIPVEIIDDTHDEAPETFILRIGDVDLARIGDGLGQGTIVDNDEVPEVRADDLTVSEAQTQGTGLRLSLSQESGKDVFVDYLLVPETAEIGSDIEPLQGTAIFMAGETQKYLDLSLINDLRDEDVETLQLVLSNPVEAAIVDAAATLTITDDDEGPALRVVSKHLQEGAPADQNLITLVLEETSAQPLTLNWQIRSGSAQQDQDFTAESGTLTFAPGESEAQVAINLIDDDIDEPDETIELQVASTQIKVLEPTTALTLIDNDMAPNLTMRETRLPESSIIASLNLQLSAPAERDLPGELIISPTSANLNEDFNFPSLNFVIPAGRTDFPLPVRLVNDSTDEIDERFDITARLSVDDPGDNATATIYIEDDDPEPILDLEDLSVGEGQAIAQIRTLLSEPSGKAITLTYAPTKGSAEAGEEFEDGTRTFTIPAGVSEVFLPLPIIDDFSDEIDEHFTVTLLDATKAQVGKQTASVTVIDDDDPVRVTLGPTSVPESAIAQVPITLAQASGHPVELELETVSGVAVAGEDYESRIGRVLIEPGQLSGTFQVNLIDDGFEELTETFGIRIASARNAQFDSSVVPVEILDNDLAATLSVRTENMTEGRVGRIVFTLAAESNNPVAVEYDVVDGTAQNYSNGTVAEDEADYDLEGGALIFQPGETEKTLEVFLRPDSTDEADETFTVSILASSVDIDQNEIPVTIIDTDPSPQLAVTLPAAQEDQGQLLIDFNLTDDTEREVRATIRLNTPEPVFGPSFDPQDLALIIPPGQSTVRLSVPIKDDIFDEFEEEITLEVLDLVNAEALETNFRTLISDDDAPSRITLVDRPLSEAAPGAQDIEVILDKPSGKPIQLAYAVQEQSAIKGGDWQAQNGPLSLETGAVTATIEIDILDDEIYEGDETFGLVLSDLVNGEFALAERTFTIEENEPLPTLLIADLDIDEGTADTLVMELDTISALPLSLDILPGGLTAELGLDLEPLEDRVVFEPGQVSLSIPIIPIDDPFDEPMETINITFAADIIQVPAVATALNIIDNDSPPELLVDDIWVREDGTADLIFKLSIASNKPLQVDLSADDETATASKDYDFTAQTLRFRPGESEQRIPLTILTDRLDENLETWRVNLSNPEAVSLPKDHIIISIEDIDPEPTLSFEDMILFEAASQKERTVLVRLSEPSGREVRAVLAASDATAQAGEDYAPLVEQLIFAPGETEQVAVLNLIDDPLYELAETFILTLGQELHAQVPRRDALVSLLDDDPRPALIYSNHDLQEGDAPTPFAIPFRLSNPAGRPLTFTLDAMGLGDGEPDITFDSLTLTFETGETQTQLTGQVIGDLRNESTQIIALRPQSNRDLDLPEDPLNLLILDNDQEPKLQLSSLPLTEGQDQPTTVRLALSYPSEKLITGLLISEDGSALQNKDYIPVNLPVSLQPGQTEIDIPLSLIEDQAFELAESFTLTLSNIENAQPPTVRTEIEVLDDDSQPIISVVSGDLKEGETSTIGFALDRPTSQPVRFTYDLTSGSARVGQDFASQPGTIVFTPGEVRKTIDVEILSDEIDEQDEVLVLVISDVRNATAAHLTTPITVIDANQRPSFIVAPAVGVENSETGGLEFTLELSHPSATRLALQYEAFSDTALAGQDFVPAAGQILLEPGQLSASIRVDLINDDLFEGDETFVLTIAYADDIGSAQDLPATIQDDEQVPTLLADQVIIGENQQMATVFLQLDRPANFPLAFAFETADGTATAGEDYRPARGRIQFAPGMTAQTLLIDLIDDQVHESLETFTLVISSELPDLEAAELIVDIVDNDPEPLLTFESLTLTEDGPDGAVDFVIRVDAPSALPIRLSFDTVFDGEATAQDVIPLRGDLEIPPGVQEVALPISVRQDNLAEGEETFSLVFSSVENARLTNTRAQIRLVELIAPTLSFNTPETVEGQDLIFIATLTPTSPRPLYFDFGVLSPQGGFEGPAQEITLPAGESRLQLRLPTIDNDIDQLDQMVQVGARVRGNSPLKLNSEWSRGTGIVRDNEPDPVLIIQSSALSEGTQGNLTLQLTSPTSKKTNVRLAMGDQGTATLGQDVQPFDVLIALADLAEPVSIPIEIIDDRLNENTETLDLIIEAEGVEIQTDRGAFVIADNDPLPQILSGNLEVREGDDLPPSLLLSSPSGRDLTMEIQLRPITAEQGRDYRAQSNRVEIPAGSIEIPLPIEIIDDNNFEAPERLVVEIVRADFMSLNSPSFTLGIEDDDQAPILDTRLGNASESEETALSLRLDRVSSLDALVNVRLAGGSASAVADHDFVNQQVLIPAGETRVDIPILFFADGVFEGDETLEIEIEAVQGVEVKQTLISVTILDQDQPPGILIEDVAVAENSRNAIAIPLQAFGAFANPVPLDFELISGTATVGDDVEFATGQILILPGTNQSQIYLRLIDDQIPEGTETLYLNISSTAAIRLPARPPRIEILDNEFFTSP